MIWLMAATLVFAAQSSQAKDPPPGTGVHLELSNGTMVEGVFQGRADGAIWIAQDQGEIAVDAGIIIRMRAAPTRTAEFKKRLARTNRRDGEALWRLAVWAKENGLKDSSDSLARKVIELEPDHDGARMQLGYRRDGAAWVTFEEGMRRRGMVQYEGEWIPQQEMIQRERIREYEEMRRREAAEHAAISAAWRSRTAATSADDLMPLIQTTRASRSRCRYVPGPAADRR